MNGVHANNLKEIFHNAQKTSREIMRDLKNTFGNEKIDYEANEQNTEIIINNSSYERIHDVINKYASDNNITLDSLNMIISVTELDNVIVIRLKYA